MTLILIAWILGCLINVGLWVLAIWGKPEVSFMDVLLGLNFLVFSWFGWITLAFCDDLDFLDDIIIYHKK